MKKFTIFLVFSFLAISALTACSPPEVKLETVTVKETTISEVPVTVEVTRLVEIEVEKEVEVTREVEVEITRIVENVVTATFTPTPLASPTPSHTPTITPTPSNTPLPTATPNVAQTATAKALAPLIESRSNGFYLVNVDIAPGLWRSSAGQSGCYWSITNNNGDIIDNHFGDSGGTVRIQAHHFQVEFNDCGRWEYLGP